MTTKLFAELGISADLLKAIDKLGFEQASPIQAEAIPILMTGRDVVVQSQTGSGKTLAFAVKERKEIDPAEMKKSLDQMRVELIPARREQYFDAYIPAVRKRMESAKQININESVVNQIAASIS